MVAIAILAIMLGSLAVLMNSTINTTINGNKHMDADTEARLALDRIAFDTAKMVKRPDVDFYFQKNPGTSADLSSDQMAFYSEASGYFTGVSNASTYGSTTSLVGYRISPSPKLATDPPAFQLERLNKGLIWNGAPASSGISPMLFLPNLLVANNPQTGSSAGWPNVAGAGSDPDYQVVGDDIFRLEVCYLVRDSLTDACLSNSPYIVPPGGANTVVAQDKLIAQDLVAVVVTIAVLDSGSRKLATTAQLQAAAQSLTHLTGSQYTALSGGGSAISAASLPAVQWQNQIVGSSLGLPKVVNAQVRVYQRYCYVTPIE